LLKDFGMENIKQIGRLSFLSKNGTYHVIPTTKWSFTYEVAAIFMRSHRVPTTNTQTVLILDLNYENTVFWYVMSRILIEFHQRLVESCCLVAFYPEDDGTDFFRKKN